ncbi:MAG: EamA family transporter, partial [Parvularculaceae bacterium]|nr:EamA family transporter [Parvularculaceae bacterium]
QTALKVAVEKSDLKDAIAAGLMPAITAAMSSPFLWGALVIYGVSIVLWLWVLSQADLSLAYPFVSLGFVVTMVFAAGFLGEHVSMLRIFGTLLIVAGCIVVARSA